VKKDSTLSARRWSAGWFLSRPHPNADAGCKIIHTSQLCSSCDGKQAGTLETVVSLRKEHAAAGCRSPRLGALYHELADRRAGPLGTLPFVDLLKQRDTT
jgi:hypothetical protein